MQIFEKNSYRIIYGVILMLLLSLFSYGEDFNITKSKKCSMGTTISHEPKRSPVGEYITITLKKEGFDFSKVWYDVKFYIDENNTNNIHNINFIDSYIEVLETKIGEVKLNVKVPKVNNIDGVHFAKPINIMVEVKDNNKTHIIVTTHTFMLSSRPLAIIFWLLALFTPWLIASRIAASRKGISTFSKFNPIWFVSGEDGRASLSLAQILIWTILVFSASFYILEVSGKLLDLTDDVLILLGITGGVSLIANIVSENNNVNVDNIKVKRHQSKWLDLFQSDGKPDLFRVQMALFTVLAVIFVTGQIYAELVFPKFPEGLLALITISNGIYLGSKGAKKIKEAGGDESAS